MLTLNPVTFVVGQSIDVTVKRDDCYTDAYHWYVPMLMSWSASDASSGIKAYDVFSDSPDSGQLKSDTLETSLGWGGQTYDNDCGGGDSATRIYVVAKDNRGNAATSALSGSDIIDVWQEDAVMNPTMSGERYGHLAVTKSVGWATSNCKCYDAGTTLYSTRAGNSITYTVTPLRPGQTFAVVMEKNSNRGQASISVNGGPGETVETYASPAQHRAIIWQRTLGVGAHTIKITNLGTAGRPRIDVDALMLTSPSGGPPPQGR